MAVQMLFCVVLPPGLVQYCSQHSCVIVVKLFLHIFCKRPRMHPYRSGIKAFIPSYVVPPSINILVLQLRLLIAICTTKSRKRKKSMKV